MARKEHTVTTVDAASRKGFVYVMGYLATALAAMTTAGAGAAVLLSLPDIRRYLQIRSM
ncbi:MAG: DUF6893 family small protein [Pseudonocardiaceae bacterium]